MFIAIHSVLRAAKMCLERFWCLKRHGAAPLQASYSEQSGSKRQNSSHKSRFLIDLDGVLVLYLHLHTCSAGQNFELGAKTMFQSSILHLKDQGTAEERLWRAVITKSLEEWICGPLSFSRKAEQFLFEDNRDFKAVCSSAGMDPIRLRKRLKAIRARGVQKENIPFRVRTNKRFGFPQATGLRKAPSESNVPAGGQPLSQFVPVVLPAAPSEQLEREPRR